MKILEITMISARIYFPHKSVYSLKNDIQKNIFLVVEPLRSGYPPHNSYFW